MKEKQDNNLIATTLGGIDSYYFFVDTSNLNEQLYHFKYERYIKHNELDCDAEFLNFSGKKSGFVGSWFRINYINQDFVLPVFKVGFKDPTKQKNINNIYIQLLGSGIYFFGFYGVLEYVRCWLIDFLACDVALKDFINSRVDINCFVGGVNLNMITPEMFFTSFLKYEKIKDYRSKNNDLETLYFGTATSIYRLKIYDKKKELLKNTDKIDMSRAIKINFLRDNGFDFSHLWNLEFSLKREFLKEFKTYNADDLLKNYHTIYKYLFSKVRFLGYDIDKIERYKKNDNLCKLKSHSFWQAIQDNQNFTIDIQNSDVEREVYRYRSNIEDSSYKRISNIVNNLVLNGFSVNIDRFLKAAGL